MLAPEFRDGSSGIWLIWGLAGSRSMELNTQSELCQKYIRNIHSNCLITLGTLHHINWWGWQLRFSVWWMGRAEIPEHVSLDCPQNVMKCDHASSRISLFGTSAFCEIVVLCFECFERNTLNFSRVSIYDFMIIGLEWWCIAHLYIKVFLSKACKDIF